MPVVRLISVEPSSVVQEGNSVRVTLGISPPVSEGDPGLTGGRLIGGIIVWDSWKSEQVADALIAFAFHPGDEIDTLSYRVDVADDDGEVNTNRTIQIEVNSVFDEYSVGSPSGATVRVLDRDSTGPPPPPPEDTPTPVPPPPPPPEDTPTPVPPPPPLPEDTPTPVPPPPPPPEDTPTPVPPPPPLPEDTPTPVPPPPPTPEDTPTPIPPPPADTPTPEPPPPPSPTHTPTLVPPPTNTPEPTPTSTPTAEPTLGALATTPQPSDTAPVPQLVQPELDQPSVPVISRAIPRVRDTLGGIASSPRRRTTLIIIQGLASVFAASVFARLILRRE